MAEFDYKAFYRILAGEVRTSTDFVQSLKTLLEWAEKADPHASWAALRALGCSDEPKKVVGWLDRILKRTPCPFPVRGIYFGLGEHMTRTGIEYADLYVGFLSSYAPADRTSSWLWRGPSHYPENAYLRSKSLKAAGVICNEDEQSCLGTPGHIVFSLGFATLLLAAALDARIYQRLGVDQPVGIAVGFDSGDLIRLGELHSSGFRARRGVMT